VSGHRRAEDPGPRGRQDVTAAPWMPQALGRGTAEETMSPALLPEVCRHRAWILGSSGPGFTFVCQSSCLVFWVTRRTLSGEVESLWLQTWELVRGDIRGRQDGMRLAT
jgi:hypothetical protein